MRLFLALLLGCPTTQPGDPPAPASSTNEVLPGPPDDAWTADVPEEIGEMPLIDGVLGLVFDATLKDGLTVYADCSAHLAQCLDDKKGDFAGCVDLAPVCQTDTPWEEGVCCPRACGEDFRAAVKAGKTPHDAWLDTFAGELSCFPGVEPRKAGGAP